MSWYSGSNRPLCSHWFMFYHFIRLGSLTGILLQVPILPKRIPPRLVGLVVIRATTVQIARDEDKRWKSFRWVFMNMDPVFLGQKRRLQLQNRSRLR